MLIYVVLWRNIISYSNGCTIAAARFEFVRLSINYTWSNTNGIFCNNHMLER